MKLLILQGIPASGKSTWAKEFVLFNSDYVRVNRDDLRSMRGIYWLPEQEDMVSYWEKQCVIGAFKNNKSVVLDATNINPKYLRRWVELANEYGAEVEFKDFPITLEDAIARDAMRTTGAVGPIVIRNMHGNYMKLKANPFTYEALKVDKIVQDETLPRAIICDLDGTLCIHNGRSPYDLSKVGTDSVNKPIAEILWSMQGTHNIIFLSGREDMCAPLTTMWLQENNLHIGKLYMRKSGDKRSDFIIKKEIFDRSIKNQYNVTLCIDDRDQVVRLWRKMGLTCLQCNWGDF